MMVEVTITRANQITIPKQFLEQLNLKPGEKVVLVLEKDKIIIYPKKIKRPKIYSIGEEIDYKKVEKYIEEGLAEQWK